jgi:hypothetical protein
MGLFTTDDLVTSWTSSRHGGSIALALALSRECIGDLAPGKPHDGQEFFGKTLPIFAKFSRYPLVNCYIAMDNYNL